MHDLTKLLLVLSCLFVCTGCGSMSPPNVAWHVPETTELSHIAYGSYIRIVASDDGQSSYMAEGEFLGLQDSLLVITTPTKVQTLRLKSVVYAGLLVHRKNVGRSIFGTVGLIPLAIAANGVLGIVTGSLGVLVGIGASAAENTNGQITFESQSDAEWLRWWTENAKYARFPQGVPPALRIQDLAPSSQE